MTPQHWLHPVRTSAVLLITLALTFVLATTAAATAQESDTSSDAASASAGAPKGPPPTPVRVAKARSEELAPRKKVFGEIRAARKTTVAADGAGLVREFRAHDGQRVAAGDILAQLDDTRINLELAVHAATVEAARATIAERDATVAREERDLELLRRAAAAGGTNPRELADAESALAVARAQATQARAAATVIEQQGAILKDRLDDLVIRAPFAGVVTMRHSEEGAWVSEGGAVVDLLATDELEAWFEVPQELYAAAVALAAEGAKRLTREVPIDIDAATGAAVSAYGLRVVPEVDPRSRTFRAVLRVVNKKDLLAPGIALTAFVPAGATAPRVVIPKDAILRGDAAPFVYVVRGGIAAPVNVRIAFPLGDEVALEPGSIAAGDEVVTEGNERLMGPTPVVPIAGEANTAASAAAATPAVAGKAATE
ncbi:MAG: efflux RND transporter periplasmic adaptor subunit [Planctomycetaceae bacterium]|nr:efflux RND transporter periplasmic adaptor subunit [Planctomycetaceae bacterium]